MSESNWLIPSFVQTHVERLTKASLRNAEELEAWIAAVDGFTMELWEQMSRARIQACRFTKDIGAQDRVKTVNKDLRPIYGKARDAFDEKLLLSPHRKTLGPKYSKLIGDIEQKKKYYHSENVQLEADAQALASEYQRAIGNAEVDFAGKACNLSQLRSKIRSPKRELREQAWRALGAEALKLSPKIHGLFDQSIAIRRETAANIGQPNFLEYLYKRHLKPYTRHDCDRFYEAVVEIVGPLASRANADKREELGVDQLMPWDQGVNPSLTDPIKPYSTESELVAKMHELISRIDEDAGKLVRHMSEEGNLDLMTRPGKGPGGFCSYFLKSGEPFIFCNGDYQPKDIDVVAHEIGHAFHFWLEKSQPLLDYRHAGSEFSEVASMSMELFAQDHLDVFYPSHVAKKVRRNYFRSLLQELLGTARVDRFEAWNHTHSKPNDHESRREMHFKLCQETQPDVDRTSLEDIVGESWILLPHYLTHPGYYISYGIARLGSLQLWSRYRKNPKQTLSKFKQALALGGSKSTTELFAACGIEFDFGPKVLPKVIDELASEF